MLQRQDGWRMELPVKVSVFKAATARALAQHERSFGDAWGFNTTAAESCGGANASARFAEFMCAHHAPPESLANAYAASRPLALPLATARMILYAQNCCKHVMSTLHTQKV